MLEPRPTWVVADAHGGARAEDDRALLALLRRARALRPDLLFMGDLFAVWLAKDRFLTPFQREVIDALCQLRSAGVRIDFVVGNRDYLVSEGQLGRAFDAVHEEEAVIGVAGVPTLVTHGDRLRHTDWLYRSWRRLSRASPVLALVSLVPKGGAVSLATALEHRMRSLNRRYKTGDLPFLAISDLGRRAARAGAKRALVGHFHHDRIVDVPGGVPVYLAPAWLEQRRILVAEAGGALVSVDPLERFG